MCRRTTILILVLLAAVACSRKQDAYGGAGLRDDGQDMTVRVKAGEEDPKFTFLFWEKSVFDSGIASKPYHVSEPTGEIDSYQEVSASDNSTDFHTGRAYPENYEIAVCTGYAPYGSVYPAVSDDYTKLSVSGSGSTDVLVSRNYLEGSSIFPFSGNLYFFHPQIMLVVKAKLKPDMAKYIKEVTFSVGADNLLTSLQWDEDEKCYLPTSERGHSTWTSKVIAQQQINSSDEKVIGRTYVIPSTSESDGKMNGIDIVVSGSISDSIDGDYVDFSMSVPVHFSDDPLELNDSYELLLLFDEDQIEISALEIPWEVGGNILVPVHPIEP